MMRMGSATLRGILIGALPLVLLSCDSGTEPDGPGEPAALQIISGDEQEGVVGQQLDDPLVARVVDDEGRPVQGQVVNFVVVSGGGSVFAGSSSSNAQGIVQERWTLGTSTALAQRVEARAVDNETGEPIVFATFTATPKPDVPASMEKVAGDGAGTAGQAVAARPSVRVEDQYGNLVPGVQVTFAVASGGGTITGGAQTTGADGIATVGSWTLGPTAGAQTMTASGGGIGPVTFTVVAGAAPAARLAFSTAPPATTASGAALPTIVVRLEDQYGNTVPQAGVQVTAEVASGGGFLSGNTTQATDPQGLASFHLVLSGAPGEKTLRFSAPGLTAVISAPITVSVGQPTTMMKHEGDNQQISAGGTAAIRPAVKVTDAAGNAVAGVTVTFSIVSGGGSLAGATATTDVSGIARVGSWTVGTQVGNAQLRASAAGVPTVTFNATITASAANAMTKSAGDNQTGPAGSALPVAPSVRVTDQYGNGVPGVAVSFAVASGGGTIANPNAVSDVNGIATSGAWTLGPSTGTQTLTASAVGLPTLTFAATAVPGTGLVLTKVSGDNQTTYPREPTPVRQVIRVTDQFGNGVAGVNIHWVPSHHGSVSGNVGCVHSTSTQYPCNNTGFGRTDEQGYAQTSQWTVAATADVQTLEARVRFTEQAPPPPVTFTATVLPGLTGNVIAAGNCVLNGDATYCWGENSDGRVGDGTTFDRSRPVRLTGVPALDTITMRGVNAITTCGITGQGEVWCWGSGVGSTPVPREPERRFIAYELGRGITTDGVLTIGGTPVDTDLRFTALSVGGLHLCALGVDQRVYCMASFHTPAIGRSDPSEFRDLKPVESTSRYVALSAGETHTCAITTEGALHCWGRNSAGQIGIGTFGGEVWQPTPVVGLSGRTVVSLATGAAHSCAVTSEGNGYCWGQNGSGELGIGGAGGSFSVPQPIKGDRPWQRISATASITCALRQDGAAFCWGWPVVSTTSPAMVEPHMASRPMP